MTDKKASELLSENLTAIYGYAFSKLYDKEKVDELTSEIVYEIIMSARNLQNEDAFWGYAWKIAENTFRRFIRKTEPVTQVNAPAVDITGIFVSSPEEEYIQKETESEELEILEAAEVLKKTGEKYQANLLILTDAYEKEFVKNTSPCLCCCCQVCV